MQETEKDQGRVSPLALDMSFDEATERFVGMDMDKVVERNMAETEHILRVDEIFGPTIQGEGELAGAVTMFVRLGGCDFQCSWCDTLHAVDAKYSRNWLPLTPDDIVRSVRQIDHVRVPWVTISGGNPAIYQNGLQPLVIGLRRAGYKVAIETQGSIVNKAFADADLVTISPKPPSSGMKHDLGRLFECVQQSGDHCLKFVIGSAADFQFALDIASALRDYGGQVYVQPLTIDDPQQKGGRIFPTYRELCERVATTHACRNWRVIPQLHVLAWNNERGR